MHENPEHDPDSLARQRVDRARAVDWIQSFIREASPLGDAFQVRAEYIAILHYTATQNLVTGPGVYRSGGVRITNSPHKPPPAHEVLGHMDEFIGTLNSKWKESTPIQIAAYALWRLTWIHPFPNGNGRTARLFSYLLLNAKIGTLLHGKGDGILLMALEARRPDYYRALQEYDKGDSKPTENLLAELLTAQLINAY